MHAHDIAHAHAWRVACGPVHADMNSSNNCKRDISMSADHHLPSATELERELAQVRRDHDIAVKDRPEHAQALAQRIKKIEAELARQK
ncbi:hypothetical protein GLX_15010 [Komagataeibacter medellinensis NBRC 3288]|uniref:Uncharacterized protein n=2 Tax=Komagataeibacter medellinensis TaxID=1177712 RepID=G2I716_KOMMN|nr:hypothetical protein GLX_15010 [Komagataeibacter medellinensis NBRC 3288]